MPSTKDTSQEIQDPAATIENARKGIASAMASPGAKFILIGFITILLLVPALMVWGLVEERSRRAVEVAADISKGWGGRQLINGPYLIIPYELTLGKDENRRTEIKHAIFSADSLDISGDVEVTERKRSIYKSQLYHLKTEMKGKFTAPDLRRIRDRSGKPRFDKAFLTIGVSDVTGFRSDINISINNEKPERFLPGLNHVTNKDHLNRKRTGGGVHLPLKQNSAVAGFEFNIDMAVNGSQNLSFVPAGKTTELSIRSNWPHPGFNGKFLPETRKVSEEGFTANWTVPDLARGMEAVLLTSTLPFGETLMQTDFVTPLKFYQITSRTLKYSIAFISLVFLAIFVLELSNGQRVHWIQYTLVGLALVIFYILLLALAEQVGFAPAYLLSSAATTLLIAWYVGDALASRSGTYVTGAVLSVTYLIMYLILNEEQYALLAGSMIAFVAIAATMIATRSVNWADTSRPARQ